MELEGLARRGPHRRRSLTAAYAGWVPTNPPLASIASSMGHYAAANHPGSRPRVIGGGLDWGIFKRGPGEFHFGIDTRMGVLASGPGGRDPRM